MKLFFRALRSKIIVIQAEALSYARLDFFKKSAYGILIKAFHTGALLLVTIALTRILDMDGYGNYAHIYAMLIAVTFAIQLGFPPLVLRVVSESLVKEDSGYAGGILNFSFIYTLTTFSILAAFAWVAEQLGYLSLSDDKTQILYSGGLLALFIPLARLYSVSLRALGSYRLGLLPEQALRPLLFLVFVLSTVFILGSQRIDASVVITLHLAAAGFCVLTGVVLLRCQPQRKILHGKRRYQFRAWTKAALFLAFTEGIILVIRQIDIIMMGFLIESHQVGAYHAASQIALLVTFALSAINSVVGQDYARLYFSGKISTLQGRAQDVTWLSCLTAAPAAVIFWIYGGEILTVAFGSGYGVATTVLTVLVTAQLLSALFGPSNFLLNMTGNEVTASIAGIFAIVLNVILNLILIPRFEMEGAAIATAISFVAWNAMLCAGVYWRLRINPTLVR